MSKVPVSVSISGDQLGRFPEVVEQARAVGLEVSQEMDLIGVVSGSIEEDQMADLRGVPGVAAVEPDRQFEIAPPDSAIQSVPDAHDDSGDRYDEGNETTTDLEPSPPDADPAKGGMNSTEY
jgi:hypothetical protein